MTKMKLRTTAVYYITFHVSAVQFKREREQMKERKKKATYGREKNGEIST